jgi:hypothetical protein
MVPGWRYSDHFETVEVREEASYSGDPNGCSNNLEEDASGVFIVDSNAKKFIGEYNSLITYLSKRGYVFTVTKRLATSESREGKAHKLNLLAKRGVNGKKRYSVGLLYTTQDYSGNIAIIVVCKLR